MGDYNTYRGRIISPTEEALSMYRYWEEKYLIFMMSSVDGDKRISVHRWFAAKPCPGEYIYSRLGDVATEVNKILIPPSIITPEKPAVSGFEPYIVTVTANSLNYRSGPGTDNKIVGQIRKGEVYTIVQEAIGRGASKWGKLKSGAGWVSLDFCSRR